MPKKNKLSLGLIIIICIFIVVAVIFCIWNKDTFVAPAHENPLIYSSKLLTTLDRLMTDEYKKKRLPSNMPPNTRAGCIQFDDVYGSIYDRSYDFIDRFEENDEQSEEDDTTITFTQNPDGTYKLVNKATTSSSSNTLSSDEEYYKSLCAEDSKDKYGRIEKALSKDESIQHYKKILKNLENMRAKQLKSTLLEHAEKIVGKNKAAALMKSLKKNNEKEIRQILKQLLIDEIKDKEFGLLSSSIEDDGDMYDNNTYYTPF
jgi:hypothetical protein